MASSKINSVNLGPIWLQSGNGIPNHIGIKGTIYIDLDTAKEYINKDGFNYWEENGSSTTSDTYITEMTFNNGDYNLTLNRNDGAVFTQNLGILASDIYLTGGTYSSGTITFTNNSGGTFQVTGFTSGMTDSFTTSANLSGTSIIFNNNIQGPNLYNVNLNPLLSGKTDNTLFEEHVEFVLNALDLKENLITSGTTTQYWRGDKTWQTLDTTNVPEGSNLYFTESRVNENTNVSANTLARHNAVSLGIANGLSLNNQQLSLGLASTSSTGALSSTDWNVFNSKQNAISGPANYLTKFGAGGVVQSNITDDGSVVFVSSNFTIKNPASTVGLEFFTAIPNRGILSYDRTLNQYQDFTLRVKDFIISNSDIDKFIFKNNGNFLVNKTTDTGEKLQVEGDGKINGRLTWGSGSYVEGASQLFNSPANGTNLIPKSGTNYDFNLHNSLGQGVLQIFAGTQNINVNGSITALGGNSNNWNTAYGWGSHASAGYALTNNVYKHYYGLTNLNSVSDGFNVGAESATGQLGTYTSVFAFSSDSNTAYQRQLGADISGTLAYRYKNTGAAFGSWLKIMHEGNYNSYSPTLTGGGASGTWGINISGSSNKANKLIAFDSGNDVFWGWDGKLTMKVNDVSFGRDIPMDITGSSNRVKTSWTNNGTTFISSYNSAAFASFNPQFIYNTIDSPNGYSGLYNTFLSKHDENFGSIIALDIEPNGRGMYYKNLYGGSWQGWKRIVDEANIGSQKVDGAIKLWSTSHPNDFYISNAWTGEHWQLTSNHGSGVRVAYSDVAKSLTNSQSNWASIGGLGNVVGMLAWKHYGNSHVIFDASNGTSPSGSNIDIANPQQPWSGTYPTLMGWNGTNTYGVRVDSSRVSDSINGYNNPTTASNPNTIVYRDSAGDVSAREFVLNATTVHDTTPSAITGIFPTTNQVVRFGKSAVKTFLNLNDGSTLNNVATGLDPQDGNGRWRINGGVLKTTDGTPSAIDLSHMSISLINSVELLTSPENGRLNYGYQISNPQSGLFPAIDNSNAVITLNRHSGEYNSQLGFSSNGNLYYRSFSATAINTTQPWRTIIDSGNIGSQAVNYANSAGSAPNAGNQNPSYLVTAGDGNGLKFWASDSYKISMGAGSLYQYGPVTDYSIKMQMDSGSPGRGFTWGREGNAPIAALNATSGNFQTTGSITAHAFYQSSDYRLKNIIKQDGEYIEYTWKDGRDKKTHFGVVAQEVKDRNLITVDDKGFESVNYIEFLVKKVAELESKLKKYGLE